MKTSKLTIILAIIFVLFATSEVYKDKRERNSPKVAVTKADSNKVAFILNNIEEKLKLEEWMSNDKHHVMQKVDSKTESDKPLRLESWMTNLLSWEFAALLAVEMEKPLILEPWMKNAKYWEKDIRIYAHANEIN